MKCVHFSMMPRPEANGQEIEMIFIKLRILQRRKSSQSSEREDNLFLSLFHFFQFKRKVAMQNKVKEIKAKNDLQRQKQTQGKANSKQTKTAVHK